VLFVPVPMGTLAEIEKFVSHFSAEELAELEQIIRKARREKEQVQNPRMRNTDPISVGTILKPIGTRNECYSEMLKGPV
jgi:TATA-binding protein-associated factor Taf7